MPSYPKNRFSHQSYVRYVLTDEDLLQLYALFTPSEIIREFLPVVRAFPTFSGNKMPIVDLKRRVGISENWGFIARDYELSIYQHPNSG